MLQRLEPLFYGIVVTDRCNLECLGCKVSNTNRPDMTWSQLIDTMQNAWKRGFRELYFSGGEPMLWSDEAHTLEDAVLEAKKRVRQLIEAFTCYHIREWNAPLFGEDIFIVVPFHSHGFDMRIVWVLIYPCSSSF